jgi:hypothetical protein
MYEVVGLLSTGVQKRSQTTISSIILCWLVLCDGHQFYIIVWDWECPEMGFDFYFQGIWP